MIKFRSRIKDLNLRKGDAVVFDCDKIYTHILEFRGSNEDINLLRSCKSKFRATYVDSSQFGDWSEFEINEDDLRAILRDLKINDILK